MLKFKTGAVRSNQDGKIDYEGFIDPIVLERFGEYMLKHQTQEDGNLRDSDNWQKGIDLNSYMKSGLRHVIAWWKEHRGYKTPDGLQDALCATMFNSMGYLREILIKEQYENIGKGKGVSKTIQNKK